MATPIITSLNPDHGVVYGGYIVSLTGSNFRLPDLLPGEDKQESVRITLNGIQVDPKYVYVRRADLVEFRVPENQNTLSTLPISVDLEVSNIDASGAVIPGETTTATGIFTYHSIDIDAEKPIVKATRYLKRYIERAMGIETFLSSDIDKKTQTSAFPDEAPQRGFYITTNSLDKNIVPLCCLQSKMDKYDTILTLPKSYDLLYTIIGYAPSRLEVEKFMESFEQVIRLSPRFNIPWNYGTIETELYFEELPTMTGLALEYSGVHQFTSVLRMRGVPMLSEDREVSYIIDDIYFV